MFWININQDYKIKLSYLLSERHDVVHPLRDESKYKSWIYLEYNVFMNTIG